MVGIRKVPEHIFVNKFTRYRRIFFVNSNFSDKITCVFIRVYQCSQAVPQIIEGKKTFGAHFRSLIIGLNERTTQFDTVWQKFLYKLRTEFK